MVAIRFHTSAGLNRHTGYGKLERGLLRGLMGEGVQVKPYGPVSDANIDTLEPEMQGWLAAQPTFHIMDVLVTGSPKYCAPSWETRDKRVWLFTMSESTKVSEDWVNMINEWCYGVFVPCPSLIEVYRESGVAVPVHSVGLGVDYYEPLAIPKWRSPKYTFLTYSYGDMRKGAHLAMMALKTHFAGRDDVELVVKARSVKNNWLAGCVDPQIRIIEGHITEAEWFKMLWEADAFVFPSYAEGFGLPPREATLVGTPAIATRWLGLADVDRWGYPIPVRRFNQAHYGPKPEANHQDALWSEPDHEALAETMRWVYEHRDEADAKAKEGREYLLQNFTWQQTARRILEVLDGNHHNTANPAA